MFHQSIFSPLFAPQPKYPAPETFPVPVMDFALPDVSACSTIPRNIYQTWITKDLQPRMAAAIEKLKTANPSFQHELFDNADCRAFIHDHYPPQVLQAYDALIPGAYKADLWRYCILYLRGGVYLDIKFEPVNGFSFAQVCNAEQFCYDKPSVTPNRNAIYNAFMITYPGNYAIGKCIYAICQHVRTKFYGSTPLAPTGPILLGQFVRKAQCVFENGFDHITLHKKAVLQQYSSSELSVPLHYSKLWRAQTIYRH